MVDIKFWEENYMVDNRIIQIIHAYLKEYVNIDNIKIFPSNTLMKYIFNIFDYYFEISYDFIDNFYRIKLEKNHNNQLQNIIFLTKSKKFQKDIKLMLKDLKLSRKAFENHINAFCAYVRKILEKDKCLNFIEETYISDLKFDGIFI